MYQNTLIQSKRIKKCQKRQTHVKYLLYLSNYTNPFYSIKHLLCLQYTLTFITEKAVVKENISYKCWHCFNSPLIHEWNNMNDTSLYKNALSLVRRKYSTLMFTVVGYQVIRKKRKFLVLLWIKVFIARLYDIKFLIIIA